MARIKSEDIPNASIVDVKSAEPPAIDMGIYINKNPRFIELMDEIKAITGEAVLLMVRKNGPTKRFAIEDGEIIFGE
jgi:hypothetical protein